MFVKLMYKLSRSGPGGTDYDDIISVYECEKYTLSPNQGNPTVTLENANGQTREIAVLGANLYIMNRDGKTIDRYEF